MRDAGFEFAVRRDVRNTTIVREVDRERQFRLARAALVGVFFVALFTLNVHQHDKVRQLGAKRESVLAEQKQEARIRGHLQLEVDAHSAPAVLAERAGALHLVAPGPESSVIVERVTSSPPPARSIVASR
jgi:cell division protein FtsL